MVYADLFGWWIGTISWSIAFPIVVSIYLHRRRIRSSTAQVRKKVQWVRDFTFVWFLLGLLIFYIITVSQGSSLEFGIGNIAFELLLITYAFKNRQKN